MKKYLPDENLFLNKPTPHHPDYVIQEYKGRGANGLVFRAYNEKIKGTWACKIIPKENQPDSWAQEAQKANSLGHPSVVKCHDAKPLKGQSIDCLVLYLDFIDGVSLRDYISKKVVTMEFIEGFLVTILELFNEMQGSGITHGDLHAGNIMVENERPWQFTPVPQFRVTDFGTFSSLNNMEPKDDYLQLASIVKELLENFNFQSASPRNRFAWEYLKDNLLRHLLESDTTRDLVARNPRELYGLVKNIGSEFETQTQSLAVAHLKTPFDYLSCEQIGSSFTILDALYSDRFAGLSEIENRNNLILTGPRGCGKSTIFRSLSLLHRYSAGNDRPEDISYVGVYFRCNDLYFGFPRYELPSIQNAYDLPMHFFTATLLSIMLESLEKWATRHFKDEFFKKEQEVAKGIWRLLGIKKPNYPRVDTFKAIGSSMVKEQERAVKKQPFAKDPKQNWGEYFGVDVVLKCCDYFLQNFSFLKGRPFYFFIDDYSTPKITDALQKNLNRLLMQRSSSCFFKISTESSISYVKEDIDRKIYVEGREFELVNLGLDFIHADFDQKLHFIEDVFSKRLQAVPGYPVQDLETLLGNDKERAETQVARDYRDGKKVEYWGKSVLCELCSGDIFYLIKLVGSMVSAAGGQQKLVKVASVPKVSSRTQNQAIREEAGNFLKNLKDLPHGEQLLGIVNAFGNVVRSYLLYKDSKNENVSTPHQASRIEPFERFDLEGQAKTNFDELLRYSVFFVDLRGKSRRNEIVPRLYLRRFLIPHLRLTFSKRDSLQLETSDLELLLLHPREFENKKRLKSALDKGNSEDGKQYPLFDEGLS